MIRNDHRTYIHPAIILTFTALMGGFLAYIINKEAVDSFVASADVWLRVALEGDWFWLCASILMGVAVISFRLGWD